MSCILFHSRFLDHQSHQNGLMSTDHSYNRGGLPSSIYHEHAYTNSKGHTYRSAKGSLPPSPEKEKISLNNKVFKVHSTPGDGNCFFHAVSLAVIGDYSQSDSLRKRVCLYIIENWTECMEKIHINHGPSMTKENYVISMLHKKGWATASEIEVAANILGQPITVWLWTGIDHSPFLQTFSPISSNDSANVINVLLRNNHYEMIELYSSEQTTPLNMTVCNETINSVPDVVVSSRGKECSPTQSKARKFGVLYEPAVLNETFSQMRNRKCKNFRSLQNVSTYIDEGQKNCSPTQSKARKFGVRYEPAVLNETYVQSRNRKRRNADRLKNVSSNIGDIPEAPPILDRILQNVYTDIDEGNVAVDDETQTHQSATETLTSVPDVLVSSREKNCSPTQSKARKFGVRYEPAVLNETNVQRTNRKRSKADRLKNVFSNIGDIPEAPPILDRSLQNVSTDIDEGNVAVDDETQTHQSATETLTSVPDVPVSSREKNLFTHPI